MQLLSVGSTVGESNFHLQFTPKYRRDVFLDVEVRELCRESFRKTCEELGIGMEACEFGPDHVHMSAGARGTACRTWRRGCLCKEGKTGAVGQGEAEAVGRQLLERRILLQEHRLHHDGSRAVLHRTLPEKALDGP